MSNSQPSTQQLPRRRQSRRTDRRLSQSMNAATTFGIDNDDNETPGETTRLVNNNNYSNSSMAQQRRQSKLSASISSFQSSYNSILEEEDESSNKEKQNNDTSTPNDMYNTTLKASTEHIFGLYAVEVWRFDDSIDLLQSIPLECSDDIDIDRVDIDEENPTAETTHHTLYIRRKPQEADEQSPSFQSSAKEAYDQLTDTNSSDYLYQSETQPGIGLAGLLWSEATIMSRNNNLSRMRKQLRKVTMDHDDDEEHSDDIIDTTLQWRNVVDIASDPDQPFDERLHCFMEAGFHLATAIPFNIFHFRGMVVFFVNPHAEFYKLNSPNNIRMFQYAAQCIGSVAAMRYESRETARVKKRMYTKNWNLLKAKIMTTVRFRLPLRRDASKNNVNGSNVNGGNRRPSFFSMGALVVSMQNDEMHEGGHNSLGRLQTCLGACSNLVYDVGSDAIYIIQCKTERWRAKLFGGHAQVPPSMAYDQVIFTMFGTLVAHSLLSILHYNLRDYTGGIIVGPLGALTTLQYNLTHAPASQPRNTFLSQVVAFLVVQVLHWYELNVYIRTTLAPVIVISLTAWLGLIHPPAGAAAVAFAAKDYLDIRYSLIFFVEISITIIVSVLVNNFSDKRQYPTSWPILTTYFLPFFGVIKEYLDIFWTSVKVNVCPTKSKLTPVEVFKRIDKDGDGLLSLEEIVEAIQLLSDHGELYLSDHSPSDLATKYILNSDSNSDGFIDMKEFEASVLNYSANKHNIFATRNAFSVIDKNSDGLLDKYEVAKAIDLMISNGEVKEKQLNGSTSLQMAENMIQEYDDDGNGELDIEEFTHMMYKLF